VPRKIKSDICSLLLEVGGGATCDIEPGTWKVLSMPSPYSVFAQIDRDMPTDCLPNINIQK
jgi:hypothetical protein